MSETAADAQQYCADIVRERDEDRWLAAQYASAPLRRKLLALYAFHAELRRVPSMVSEPPLGEIRLQWWRDVLEEIRAGKPPRAHPVVEEIARAGLSSPNNEALIAEAIEANARPLYGEPFSTMDELEEWLGQADGAVDAIAALLSGGEKTFAKSVQRAGAGFAMAREGRTLAPRLKDEIRTRCIQIAKSAEGELRSAPTTIVPAILHLALTKPYARRSGNPFPVAKRLKLFSAMAFGVF